jgi:hypothetical protein
VAIHPEKVTFGHPHGEKPSKIHDRQRLTIPFRFGTSDEPLVQAVATQLAQRNQGTDPTRHVAVGDATQILDRLDEFRAVGASKFVLLPIAAGDADVNDQTERLIGEVLPVVHGPDQHGWRKRPAAEYTGSVTPSAHTPTREPER